MKQHNIHNDEALYQQIMAELKPGADEYDTLMRKGLNPASKRKPYIIYKYVAAACIAFAIIGTSLLFMMNSGTEAQIAKVTTYKVELKDNYLMKPEEAEANEALTTESITTEESNTQTKAPQKPNSMKSEAPHHEAETDESEQEFLYALITEVEHRALAEQEEDERLRRQIIEDISANIINESNNPELTL